MGIRRRIILAAASVGLLASAAACSGNSPTAATDLVPPARDTTGFIPPMPPMTGP